MNVGKTEINTGCQDSESSEQIRYFCKKKGRLFEMNYHMIAFFSGFLLDLLLGDPYWLWHPVRLLGSMITCLEKHLRKTGKEQEKKEQKENGQKEKAELRKGVWLVVFVLFGTLAVTWGILLAAYGFHPWAGVVVETVMTWRILAIKCLKVESMKVYRCLKDQALPEARKAVSMIVGRDTEGLDEEGVIKAAVETVAENTSDGVIAPMLYIALGGPVLGFFYKAVNTMDSMVGYKNERYLYFGRAAARLDDLVNFLPARISACLMIAASFLGGSCFSGKRAIAVYKRDNRNHPSPNSAQTEAVCAGALGIRLAGDASYSGKIVRKPFIGDALRPIECEDIRRVNCLLYLTAWIGEVLCLVGMILIWVL